MERGRFITFEGGEGCGKSTQVKFLAEVLEARGIKVLLTREPGGTLLSEKIRTLLREKSEDAPVDKAELLLFLAARAQLVEKVVAPALAAGTWVVSDRFSDSTFAYQGYGRGLDLGTLRLINDFATGSLRPDRTVLLDVDPAEALRRRRGRELATATEADRIESAGEAFHARLRAGFLEMAAAEPQRIITVDANGTAEEVKERVWNALKPLV